METAVHANTLHYLIAVPLLMFLGTLIHCARAWFNVYPDRLSIFPRRPMLDSLMDSWAGDNYSFWDMLAGTEYDENGYYAFFSFKNLRIQWLWTVAIGIVVLLSVPELADAYAGVVNATPRWLWELTIYRLQNLKLV